MADALVIWGRLTEAFWLNFQLESCVAVSNGCCEA